MSIGCAGSYEASLVFRRENMPSLSHYTPKASVFRRSAGGRSPRLEPATVGSSLHQLQSILTHLGRRSRPECAQAREEAFFRPFCSTIGYVPAVCWLENAENRRGWSQRVHDQAGSPSVESDPSRPPTLPRVRSGERMSLLSYLSPQKTICSSGLLVRDRRGCRQ